jgi:hypothetical protein
MLVALLALFIALGGPAQAARLISGKDIKNRSVTTKDLSKKTVKTLRTTPRGSVKESALANGAVSSGTLRDAAVTSGKIAPGSIDSVRMAPNAVGPREIMPGGVVTGSLADNAVTGSKVVDGSLDSRDIARFAGRFRVAANDVPPIDVGKCWAGRPRALAPELAGADIRQDLVLVTPDKDWPEDKLTFTVKNAPDVTTPNDGASLFVLAACNITNATVEWPRDGVGFRYAVIDLP